MRVIVDTCVWSLALRRNTQSDPQTVAILRDLIVDGRVALLGAVRQEILSGIRERVQFEQLQEKLRAFPNLDLDVSDYELAAAFYNTCRQNGIQGANTDFLICAAAVNRNYKIFTTDKDFTQFKALLPIDLVSLEEL